MGGPDEHLGTEGMEAQPPSLFPREWERGDRMESVLGAGVFPGRPAAPFPSSVHGGGGGGFGGCRTVGTLASLSLCAADGG